MHGLMGDRLLKRFLKGIRRRSSTASANEAEPKLASGAEVIARSNDLENVQAQGKEEEESIKTTKVPKDDLNLTSSATQSLDGLQRTK